MTTASIASGPVVKAKKSPVGQPAVVIPDQHAQAHIAWRVKNSRQGKPEEIEYIEVSPDVASWILDEYNTHNRPFSDRHSDRLAGYMVRGVWYPATQVVAFSWDGVLINAQHTLGAIETSGETQKMIFAWNLDPETQAVFDTQSKRTVVQAVKLAGEDPALSQAVAAVVKMTYQIRHNTGTPASWVEEPTHGEYTHMITQEHRDAAEVALRIRKAFGKAAVLSAIGAAYYVCHQADSAFAKQFFTEVELGGVPGNHPAAQLRQKLLARKSTGSMSRQEQARVYDLIVRAFEKARKGDTTNLSWTTPNRWLIPR